MIWIDFALLWYAAFCLCSILGERVFQWERLALAFILSLALKSLVLFFLVRFGIQPTANIQIGTSFCVLAMTLIFSVKPDWKGVERSGESRGLIWITYVCVGVLFLFSMVNSWFFPITESDAIWYHIRGMSFFHEVQFDSEWVVPQLKQYPPFIPLLFTYLIAFKVEFLKILFPLLYLCLNIIFYSRVLSLTENRKMACLFTMVMATTPYFWWHGVLPFLDMTTAVFYSTGTLYWYLWVQSETKSSLVNANSFCALVSGLLLGVAAWTRIEFLLYDLVPIFLTIFIFSRYENANLKSLRIFFLSLLLFPSIWLLNLVTFEMDLWNQIKMVGGVCAFLWVLALGLTWGEWKIPESSVLFAFAVAVVGYFILLLLVGVGPVPVWKKILISLYRASTVHVFYLFTPSLVIFLFFEKLKELPEQKKMLGCFLILFLFTHLAIFSYATPKWSTLGEFVYATFIQPGNSVNLSDTRGMMSIYPVFIFFIASLPFVKRRLINE